MNYNALNSSLYEHLLLDSLSIVYSAIDKSKKTDWEKYAYLLIDKFAIHSSSFYHLSNGIIEHNKSGETVKVNGYDLFTVNSTFRAIMETYATFHNLFIEPKSEEEVFFKVLIWKIDGLNEKQKYKVDINDFKGAEDKLKVNQTQINYLVNEIKESSFYKKNKPSELLKVFNPDKKRYSWKFIFESGQIKPMRIMSLIEHTCKTRGFINAYRHTSTHTHSGYLSIEEFENFRNKQIPESYTKPLISHAILITCMLIYDICSIDKNANSAFEKLPIKIRTLINGITKSIRNSCSS